MSAKKLAEFIKKAVSPYHTVEESRKILEKKGFKRLEAGEDWKLAKGGKYYVDRPAVRDGSLITAGSTGGLLMAKLILEYLDVFDPDTLEYWYTYFSTGNAQAFFSMMQSL